MSGPHKPRVVVTGGAGFIGSHVSDALLAQGYGVRVLDCLDPQVHGPERRKPAYLDYRVEFILGDVRDRLAVDRALQDVQYVIHLAAAVGVGQSMYEIEQYASTNALGTAVLLEQVARRRPFARLVVASSMSVYGEGAYVDGAGRVATPMPRTRDQLQRCEWEPRSADGQTLRPVPTSESKPLGLESIYALQKYEQERASLLVGAAYDIPTVALRFFNVYGPRQALSNPYTGVLAIFASRLLNGKPPLIFEDGRQQRDFVSVYDIARACVAALKRDEAVGQVINIGSGRNVTISELAERIAEATGRAEIEPEISHDYRVGDIRHCFADISLARQALEYEPQVELERGISDLAKWLESQSAADCFDEMREDLVRRGLSYRSAERPGAPAAASATTEPETADAEPAPSTMEVVSAPPEVSTPAEPAGPAAAARNGHSAPSSNGRSKARPVLITGGAGFIGCNLAARLAAKGRHVLVLDNFHREGVNRNMLWLHEQFDGLVTVSCGDVRNSACVTRLVDRAAAVIHLAGQTAVTTSREDPAIDFAVNTIGTFNVLEALRHADRRIPLLHASTNKVYGNLADVPLVETQTRYEPQSPQDGPLTQRGLAFHSPHACSKGAADQYVLEYAKSFDVPAAVLRLSCIYGPHQHAHEDDGWVAHLLRRAIADEPITIFGNGKQVRDVLEVADLVDAFLLALDHIEQVRGQALDVGGSSRYTLSLLELVAMIEQISGRRPEVAFDEWRTDDQRYYVSDTEPFEQATGWRPRTSPAIGVRRLHDWLRAAAAGAPSRTRGGVTTDARLREEVAV